MVKIGSIYKMQLLAVFSMVLLSSGCGSSSSESAPPDTIAPSAPTALTAVAASSTRVSLRWVASTDNIGVTGYTIYRNSALLATMTTATTVYSDITVTAAATYTYAVAALDGAGNASALSSSVTATTIAGGLSDGTPPSEPGTLTAIATTSGQISLSWVSATDNIGVSGYNIYRATSSLGPFVIAGTTPATSFTNTGLTSGTTYYYIVKAFDGVPSESTVSSNVASATAL
jgi:fibronectin type 3 domain-containing protein